MIIDLANNVITHFNHLTALTGHIWRFCIHLLPIVVDCKTTPPNISAMHTVATPYLIYSENTDPQHPLITTLIITSLEYMNKNTIT